MINKKYKNKNYKKISILMFIVFILTISCLFEVINYSKLDLQNNIISNNTAFAESSTNLNNTNVQRRTLDVLVIRIDPLLSTQGGVRASVWLKQRSNWGVFRDYETTRDEYIQSISYASNGLVNVNIVSEEILNEFPTYISGKEVTLDNGTTSPRLDETTWVRLMQNGINHFHDSSNTSAKPYRRNFGDFNYEYLINKFNLVERRNNNEFDMVWLVDLNDSGVYETVIVGKSAYWDNGSAINKNCSNFQIMALTLPRSETYMECYGHAAEYTMQRVYENNWYVAEEYTTVSSLSQLQKLSPWRQFLMYDRYAPNISIAGCVHFAPNASSSSDEYNWTSSRQVQSYWQDWKYNYPYLQWKPTLTNSSAWNNSSVPGFDVNIKHKNWWLSIMPHTSGRDAYGGYSNNWWDYLIDLDWITSATSLSNNNSYIINDAITDICFSVKYNSGKTGTYTLDKISANTTVTSGGDCVNIESNGTLRAIKAGKVTLQTKIDGKTYSTTINIIDNSTPASYTVVFDTNGGSPSILSEEITYDGICQAPSSDSTSKTAYTLTGWKILNSTTIILLNPGQYYSCKNWVDATNVDPGGTITLQAVWTPTNYTLTFKYPDSSQKEINYTIETTYIDFPSDLSRPYSTLYWQVESTQNSTWSVGTRFESGSQSIDRKYGDVVFVGVFEEKSFKISYNLNGGNGNISSYNTTVYPSQSYTFPDLTSIITKKYYKIKGYSIEIDSQIYSFQPNQSVPVSTLIEYADLQNETNTIPINILWEGVEFKINYYVNNQLNETLSPKNHTYGKATILPVIDEEDKTFNGWYLNDDFSGEKLTSLNANQEPTFQNENGIYELNLYGELIDQLYTIYFYDDVAKNNPNLIHTQEVVSGTAYNTFGEDAFRPEKEPTEKYIFVFQNWQSSLGFPIPTENYVIDGNKYFYAFFIQQPRTYEITFYNEDGTQLIATQSFTFGQSLSYSGQTPTKESTAQYSYTFAGWSKNKNSLTTETLTVDGTFNSVYAVFEQHALSYEITFYNEDGSLNYGKQSFSFGQSLSYSGQTPTKESTTQYSYTFIGWSKNKNSLTPETLTVDGTFNNVYAVFEKHALSYEITFYNEDGTQLIATQSFTFGQNLSYSGQTPTKESTTQYSYTFIGWSKNKNSLTPETLTVDGTFNNVYAVFEQHELSYEITFYNEDGSLEYGKQSFSYNDNLIYTGETPTKESTTQYSYTFAGWSKNKNSLTPETLTVDGTFNNVYAVFEQHELSYEITFYNEDGSLEYGKQSFSYNDNLIYTGETPTKESTTQYSYTFAGWSKNKNSLTPETLTVDGTFNNVYAVFEQHELSYEITFYNEDGSLEYGKQSFSYNDNLIYTGETPTKESTAQYSYTFAGWSKSQNSQTAETLTVDGTFNNVYAVFEQHALSYEITFYNEDGTQLIATQSFTFGQSLSYSGQTPTKDSTAQYSYTFAGWSKSKNSLTTQNLFIDGTYSTVYAVFNSSLQQYEVKFFEVKTSEVDESVVSEIVEISDLKTIKNYGEKLDLTSIKYNKDSDLKYDYNFIGWLENSNLTGECLSNITILNNINLYAKFIKTNRSYNVVLYYPSSQENLSLTITFNDGGIDLTSLQTPLKESTHQYNFSFDGWYTKNGEITGDWGEKIEYLEFSDNAGTSANTLYLELYPKFNSSLRTYTLSFYLDKDSTSPLKTLSLSYGDIFDVNKETAEKPNDDKWQYEFIGWANEDDILLDDIISIKTDINLYAQFDKKPIPNNSLLIILIVTGVGLILLSIIVIVVTKICREKLVNNKSLTNQRINALRLKQEELRRQREDLYRLMNNKKPPNNKK